MGERTTSETQMTALNQKILDQNNRLQGVVRTANEITGIQINTLDALNRQGQVIDRNIAMTDTTKYNLKYTQKNTDQMRRRNLCIKLSMWISVILLFAANIASIIFKLAK